MNIPVAAGVILPGFPELPDLIALRSDNSVYQVPEATDAVSNTDQRLISVVQSVGSTDLRLLPGCYRLSITPHAGSVNGSGQLAGTFRLEKRPDNQWRGSGDLYQDSDADRNSFGTMATGATRAFPIFP